MKKYLFGIDIGGTTVKCGFFDTKGTFLESWEIPTRKENGGEKILPDIAESLKSFLQKQGISAEEVEGLGVGVPGPVLKQSVVERCVNLGWSTVDVAAELGKMLDGIRVLVNNDANVAALGEMWRGGGRGFHSMLLVTLGTGVGGGYVLEDKIVSGAHGAAAEIGHITVNERESIACNCGRKGCLEQYASATGIVRKAKELLEDSPEESSLRKLEEVTAKAVFDAAKEGDVLALKTVDFMGKVLGRALADISAVIDPEVFVLGGGVSRAGQMVIDVVQKYYAKRVFPAMTETPFRLAVLGNDAGMYGAAFMILGKEHRS